MLVTVQLADLGLRDALRAITKKPKPASTPGLRSAEVAVLAPLAMSGPPAIRRAGLIAFWDDEDAFDRWWSSPSAASASPRPSGSSEPAARPSERRLPTTG